MSAVLTQGPKLKRLLEASAHFSTLRAMDLAVRFLASFPEAQAYHLTILSSEKRCLINKGSIAPEPLRKQLKVYMDMQNVHVFIRPLLGSLVFLDLDDFQGSWESVVQLRPRVLSETSPGNFQAWYVMPAGVASKSAMWAMQELVRALGADTRSAKMTQQGRLPGSWNIKTGRGCQVKILHSSVGDLDESVLSKCLLPLPKVRVDSNRVVVSSGAAGSDRSATDWRTCCEYFESHPGATVEMAMAALAGMVSPHNFAT